MPTGKKRRITAEDLYRFELINDCQISPDGTSVVWTRQRVNRKTEKKYNDLFVSSADGKRSRQYTFGEYSDTHPRWAPDGKEIAFLSNRENAERPNLYLMLTDGGEARKLTDLHGSFGDFQWLPDGRRLICAFQKTDADEIEREKDEQKKKLGLRVRHITRVHFKQDGEGFLPHERTHLWSVDARTGKAKQLTDGDFDESDFTVSPDGKWIAFTSNRSPDPHLEPENFDLWIVSTDGGELRRIDTPFGPKWQPSFSPCGTKIAYIGIEGAGSWGRNANLFVTDIDGGSSVENLTGAYDIHLSQDTLGDLGGATEIRPTWSLDGACIYFQVSRHANTELRSIKVDGSDMRIEIGGPGVVGTYSFDTQQKRIAYFCGTMTDPGQVRTRTVSDGRITDRETTITRVNRRIFGSINLGHIEEIWFDAADSSMKLQGWILHPPEFDPSKTYPSILEIHGGPHLQYGNLFMHEFAYLAAYGYVVYFCNPRGGQGYGEKHALAIDNGWGTVDYDDLMAFADLVADRSYIDTSRRGVTGGSYGGYMTNWIIGHTDRFAAAVTQRCVSNLTSMFGSSDFNWSLQREFGDEPPWENIENWWERSPIAHIGNAKTPTLVIHSERDFRCDIEQGEQIYVALKRLGVDTEFVRFLDESHGLSRGGRTDRRIERLERIRGWFDKYLKREDAKIS